MTFDFACNLLDPLRHRQEMHRCRQGYPHNDAAGSTAVTVAVRGDAEQPSFPGRTPHPPGLRHPRHHPQTAPAASTTFVASVGIAVTGSFPPRSSLGPRTFAVAGHRRRGWPPCHPLPVAPILRESTELHPQGPWHRLPRPRTALLQLPLLTGIVLVALLLPPAKAVTVDLLRYP